MATVAEPSAKEANNRKPLSIRVLQVLCAVLILQLLFILVASSLRKTAPVFVPPFRFPGADYHAYYIAAHNWREGTNPYFHARFVTPPVSLWAGLLFGWISFEKARWLFVALNVATILGSIALFSKASGLTRKAILLVMLITALYYPFSMVTERGNVDGFILASLVLATCARNRFVAACSLAFGVATKIYPGLLIPVLARKRQWFQLIETCVAIALFNAPFSRYGTSWIVNVTRRSEYFRINENLSPAALFWVTNIPGWKIAFFAFWLGTLGYVMAQDSVRDWQRSVWRYAPWMVSIPTMVYIYCGILYLPLLVRTVRDAEERGFISRADWLLLAGLFCVSIEAPALSSLLPDLSLQLYLAAPMGTALMMLSGVLSSSTSAPDRETLIG